MAGGLPIARCAASGPATPAARERLLARAASVGGPEFLDHFMARRENARTLALAEQWTGEPP